MGCNNSKPAYYNSFHGCYISFCGYNISFCGCNNSKSDCYILFSACSKSKRDLCFSYATTYNLVDAFLSFKVLHETDAQRSQALRLLRIKEAKTFNFALTSKIQNKLYIKPKTRNSVKPVLQEAFYLSVLIYLRFVFSVLLFIIIFFRCVIRVLLFIISFFRFNIRICGYVNRNCRFAIINLLCVIRILRVNNRDCRFVI